MTALIKHHHTIVFRQMRQLPMRLRAARRQPMRKEQRRTIAQFVNNKR
jgi:hypothetical protein